MITISLVIPTVGRLSLVRALRSLLEQSWEGRDEILVVSDGERPQAQKLSSGWRLPIKYLEVGPFGHWGHGIRNFVNEKRIASGTHLVSLDDDDILLPGAITAIREELQKSPGVPHAFRVRHGGCLIWREIGAVQPGNIITGSFVTPNKSELLGTFGPHHWGDFEFIKRTVEKFPPGSLRWDKQVIGFSPPSDEPHDRHLRSLWTGV